MLDTLKRIILPWLFAILLLLPSHVSAAALTEPAEELPFNIQSKSALLMDYETGSILYEKNSHEKRPMASITKIMTLLLAMEALEDGRLKLDDTISVSEHAASMGGSTVFLMLVKHFLYQLFWRLLLLHLPTMEVLLWPRKSAEAMKHL